MKKSLLILMLLVLVVALVACGGEKTPEVTDGGDTPAVTTEGGDTPAATTTKAPEAEKFTVKFVDADQFGNAVINESTVARGKAARAPLDPSHEGYIFLGWDVEDYSSITADTTITAIYRPVDTYSVTFYDADGKAIEAGNNLIFAEVDSSAQNEITIPAGGFAFTFYYNSDNTGNQELYDIYTELLPTGIFNATTSVDLPAYTFAYVDGWLEVMKEEEEAPESSEEAPESSEEAPAESSEEEEESSEEAPAESSEEEKTSAPSTSAPATSDPAPVDDGAPIGLIVGIVAGVAVIAVVVILLIKRKK
jgi:hypothetical protein